MDQSPEYPNLGGPSWMHDKPDAAGTSAPH